MHDAYLRKRLGDRRITHFFSSEQYGEHVSRGLRHALIDELILNETAFR